MKYTWQLLVLMIIIGGLYACDSKHEHKSKQASQTTKQNHQHAEQDLRLDNGKKWQANPATSEGITNMTKRMAAFASNESGSYRTLKADLEKEFQMIFKKCTMKGEAHNQLHHYLLPMKKLFGNLASDSPTSQKATFKQLNKHLDMYTQYFE